jgi:hypothetical protein
LYQGTASAGPSEANEDLGFRGCVRTGKGNRRSLRYATPDFLWKLVALADLMRLSLKRKAHTRLCPVQRGRKSGYAPVGACDFFNLACSLWLESWEEHLPTSIAGVLRLRAISRPLCDRSARRFAQDDGFVGGEKDPVSYAENTKRSKKSQALGMTR